MLFMRNFTIDFNPAGKDHAEILKVTLEHNVLFQPNRPIFEFLNQSINAGNGSSSRIAPARSFRYPGRAKNHGAVTTLSGFPDTNILMPNRI